MKRNHTILGLFLVVILTVSIIAIPVMPKSMAKLDAKGKSNLVAKLTNFDGSASDTKGKDMFWFDDDLDPTSIRYQIVLSKIDVNDNSGKGLNELLTKVHIHFAPNECTRLCIFTTFLVQLMI